jgi:hypothetical protein
MLLIILTAITAVSYVISVNASTGTKMAVSYLISTFILVADIFVIVTYVKNSESKSMEIEYQKRLENEKKSFQEKIVQKSLDEDDLKEKELKVDEVLKVKTITDKLLRYANTLSTIDLRDYTMEIDDKIARASKIKRGIENLSIKYKKLKSSLVYVKNGNIDTSISKLKKSASYCKMYYTSEDSEEEAVRERVMRSNAKESFKLLKSVNSYLEGMK